MHKEIVELKEISKFQEGAVKALQIGVNGLQNNVKMERECVIKLESHSRRNNLNFFSIPEVADESFAKTEAILGYFMDKELQVEDVEDISIERAQSRQTVFGWQASTNYS